MTKTNKRLLAICISGIMVLAACAKPDVELLAKKSANEVVLSANPSVSAMSLPVRHRLTVFAAASLTGAF
ncbi:MAG: hypothetical protein WAV05_06035 [Anaerolineales bacterium]